ncbi:hypothetical protein BMS3Abin03_00113 [bacterium BMS3Abin03]|nr:hypothetical protein BMS3Abin03_00113 [bacterium BMS3Abin03]
MNEIIKQLNKKSVIAGFTGGLLLLAIYFLIVSVANSFSHAIDEFLNIWYWIAALSIGFGFQIGLYAHVRQTIKLKKEIREATSAVAVGAGTSTVSMIACCAHHLTDILPVLGLSAAAAFLSTYQLIFMSIGVISNIIGITYMLSIITRHHLFFEENIWLSKLGSYNFKKIFRVEIPLLSLFFILSIFTLQPSQTTLAKETNLNFKKDKITLELKKVSGNGIWVDVNGEYPVQEHKINFHIKFTTHSGSMDFQVEKIAFLKINGELMKIDGSWNGTSPGGHHRSGDLIFENIPGNVSDIELILSYEGRFGTRSFEWKL